MHRSPPVGHAQAPKLRIDSLAHLKSTILWAVLPEVVLFTLFSLIIVAISRTVHSLELATTLLTVYGTILSLLLTFKTTAALASYHDGRRLWHSVISASRAFSRACWLHVPDCMDGLAVNEMTPDEERRMTLIERKTYINLLGAFAIALKHYVRGEPGPYYTDLYPLVNFLPRYRPPPSDYFGHLDLGPSLGPSYCPSEPHLFYPFSPKTTSDLDSLPNDFDPHTPLLSVRSPDWHSDTGSFVHSEAPLARFFADVYAWIFRRHCKVPSEHHRRRRRKRKQPPLACRVDGDNVPLEIILALSGYVADLERRKSVNASAISSLLAALQSLSDALTGLEQILLAPVPLSYSLLLQHAVWLFLLLLPSHCLASLGWLTVPAVAICSVLFLGFLRLGDQIENPLGYDSSDLDLESFVNTVLKELRELCARPSDEWKPSRVVFVEGNRPFASNPLHQDLSAAQLVALSIPVDQLHQKLRAAGGCLDPGTVEAHDWLDGGCGGARGRTMSV